MFYPGTDAAVQIPVAAAVARHVARLAQRLDTPQVTGENLQVEGTKMHRIIVACSVSGASKPYLVFYFRKIH